MTHLTRSQRDQLYALIRAKHPQQEVAKIVGCHQSTISRECKRNRTRFRRSYNADVAQQRADARRQGVYDNRSHWYDDTVLRCHVETELRDRKTPQQIAGRIKQQGWSHTVSHPMIYGYIERNKEEGGDLHRHLRYQGKKYKWRGMRGDNMTIPNRRGIELRPEIVQKKERAGDWESDLVVSCRRGKGAVATFVERLCMYFRAVLVINCSADEMVRASHCALGNIPPALRHTMTHDNGREISKHEQIADGLSIEVYCARPYRSCDRGLNEFMNRELRRFFPKGTDFSTVTQMQVDSAVDWLNNCPRRTLNYRTPKEVFEEHQSRIMHFTV